jgi:hypothetical protein
MRLCRAREVLCVLDRSPCQIPALGLSSRRRFAHSPIRRFAVSPLHPALYNCPRTSHIPRPYVAVDIDPDFAHHTGDCLRTPSISGSNATAAQRGLRCCLRLRDDREHFRGSDYDCPHESHGLPRWNILRRYSYPHDFSRQTECREARWSLRERDQNCETGSNRDRGARYKRGSGFNGSSVRQCHHLRDAAILGDSSDLSNPSDFSHAGHIGNAVSFGNAGADPNAGSVSDSRNERRI